MFRTRRSPLPVLLILLALPSADALGQVQTGTPPFGSFAGGPDVINLGNLNAHIAIPLLHKPGRGLNLVYDVTYDSSVWYPVGSVGNQSWQPVTNWGWQVQAPTGYVTNQLSILECTDHLENIIGETDLQNGWTYHDPFGTSHTLSGTTRYLVWGSCLSNVDINVVTQDGSGYRLITAGGGETDTVYDRLGTVVNDTSSPTGGGTFTDRNGNVLSLSSGGVFTDTLGTTALTVSGSGTFASPIKLTYTAPSGASPYYQINYTNYTVATGFGISGISEYRSGAAVPLPTSIALPDGSQYSFGYEATPGTCTPYSGTTCVTGRLASVTLPTGGSITYSYTGGNHGIFSDGTTAGLTRVLSDGAGWSATWTYSRSQVSGSHWKTTITDPTTPTANQTAIDFQGTYETERKVYQGSTSGTLLQTVDTCYNGAVSPCTSTAITLPITQTSAIIKLDSSGLQSRQVHLYNSYGLPTEVDDQNYSSGSPGSLIRKTLIAYASLGNNIVGMPSSVTVCTATGTDASCNGTGTVMAQTTYCYDEATPSGSTTCAATGPPTATSGTPQHVAISGSRGNATTVNRLVAGTTFLSTTTSYFDTGNPKTVTDVNSAQTTYNYPDATSTCGNAFPTSVTEPLSMSRSMTWNCIGSVLTQLKDENGQATD